MNRQWNGFNEGIWQNECNVSDFIKKNYTLYEGDDSFLAGTTEKTKHVWDRCTKLLSEVKVTRNCYTVSLSSFTSSLCKFSGSV